MGGNLGKVGGNLENNAMFTLKKVEAGKMMVDGDCFDVLGPSTVI
jgi:hypothetical protein